MNFNSKHIVVTGAANGMGRLLTRRFVSLGARVAALDIDTDGLRSLDEQSGSGVLTFECDVSDPLAIRRVADLVLRELGHVDILVNNAGIVSGSFITELSDEALTRTFAVNTLAPFRVTKAFLPSMISRDAGHIVTVASAGGFVGAPRLSDYSASKFAAVGFDDSLRMEMKQLGHPIRTTLICPFFVGTEMFTGVESRFPRLLPVMTPEYVVERTIRAVYRRRSRLILPWFVYTTFLLRLLPVPWFDRLATFFGVTGAMDTFQGRARHKGSTEPSSRTDTP